MEIDEIHNELVDALFSFADKFNYITNIISTYENPNKLNKSQKNLLIFYYFVDRCILDELKFLFIGNKYGFKINKSFSKCIKLWGAIELSKYIDNLLNICEKYKLEIKEESKKKLWCFSPKLKILFNEFSEINGKILGIIENEVEIICKYIKENIEIFEIIRTNDI